MAFRALAGFLVVLGVIAPLGLSGEAPDAAERGRQALTTRAFTTAIWTQQAYDNLWRYWNLAKYEKPADYYRVAREYYGLHEAPYPNGNLPMGLRIGPGLITKGLTTDCLLCHGGSILGKSYIGLGNASLDIQELFEDLNEASGIRRPLPFTFSNVRGTSEAGGMAVYLLGLRNPDLSFRFSPIKLDLHDDMCEDAPAWWLLKKKKTMYHTGGSDARSVRSIMQFMMGSAVGPDRFVQEESTFRDIQAFLLSLESPKYPFAIDARLAARGEMIFNDTCARCHGTYGKDWTYPNKIIPLETIGTDPQRYRGITKKFADYYDKSWFAQEVDGWFGTGYKSRPSLGYQAPPLDGVWATAPYFHNGSVPTLYHVLNSESRPKIFTRSYRTNEADYDQENVGWKVQILDSGASTRLSPYERRKIYDARLPGRGNGGHTFGDSLTDSDRRAVIEYLKTL